MIGGTRGGYNRARIIKALNDAPLNANQMSTHLGLDYSTIRHHVEVMEKNDIITTLGDGYGMVYMLTENMIENYDFFEEIWNKIVDKNKSNVEES